MEKPTEFLVFLLLSFLMAAAQNNDKSTTSLFHVGVILDLTSLVGKMSNTSITMAIDDFYAIHRNYTTKLVLHTKDSNNDVVQAASAALDLLENVEVEAIIGPQKSSQAMFISNLSNKTHVPVISFSATNPSLSSTLTPYFVRATVNDAIQVNSISAIIKAYGWREAVPIYEDSDFGRGIIPYLIDSLENIDCRVPYRSGISLSATDDQIMEELYKLMTMQSMVFIVHMSTAIGPRLFRKANDAGMMTKGYVWIITDGLTNILDSLDPSSIDSIQGAIGVKRYVPGSTKLNDFTRRWRKRFEQDNPNIHQPSEPSIFSLCAYDTVWALALAAENIRQYNSGFMKPSFSNNLTELERLGVSTSGPQLLKEILGTGFKGLSGDFYLVDGELQSSPFQIVNVIGRGDREIGFWTPQYGLSRHLNQNGNPMYSTLMTNLSSVIWPGESIEVPKGWQIPVSGRKLRIGVPVNYESRDFVKMDNSSTNNVPVFSGYCIDVFEAVLKKLPYAIPYEYLPFYTDNGSETYDNLVDQVYYQTYDAVVGDVTIRANRSLRVDFTLPYTDSGVAMLVAVKENTNKNAWIFLKPLTLDLWLASLAVFIYTGFVVWVLEHRINTEFRGPISQQIGTIFYFSFSTLVFAHREKLENLLSRLVVIIWVFVVLILTSSYTASLTSMLTVQQLQPVVTDIHELQRNGDYVGYHKGSFVEGLLKQLKFDPSKIRVYDDPNNYAKALSDGSHNGGVAAIIHEVPYIKSFLSKHCTGYTMVGPIFKTAGFGFVFPKGSPLVPDMSRAILTVTEDDSMVEIEKRWFGDPNACQNQGNVMNSSSLSFNSFWGLFLITGAASTGALLIYLIMFISCNWQEMRDIDRDKSISRRLVSWVRYYNQKDLSSKTKREGSAHSGDAVDIETSHHGDSLSGRVSFSDRTDICSAPGDEGLPPEIERPCRSSQLVPIVIVN